MGTGRLFLGLLTLCVLLHRAASLRFYLANAETRCFSFESIPNTLMRGTALADAGAGAPELDVVVKRIPHGPAPPIYRGHLVTSSKFSFRTPPVAGKTDHAGGDYDSFDEEDDDDDDDPARTKSPYSACVTLAHGAASGHDGARRAVTFHVKPAAERRAGETAANDGSVKSVSLAMRQMHETLGQLTKDIAVLQKRERKLLRRNKKVGGRIVWLAVVAIGVLCATAAVQIVYFMNFFKQKKLI